MAVFSRKEQIDDRLVHYSDRGVQYTSICYTQRLEDIGAVRSVGSKGDSYDNAAAEAVNSLYKKELINGEGPWQDAGDVTVATAEWVSWYNNDGLHSACGNVPPGRIREHLANGPGSYYNHSGSQSIVASNEAGAAQSVVHCGVCQESLFVRSRFFRVAVHGGEVTEAGR
jgi:Integrase core domain